jgi:predicted helicase
MPRAEVMKNMIDGNTGIIVGRNGASSDLSNWGVVCSSTAMIDLNIFRRGGGALFPYTIKNGTSYNISKNCKEYLQERGYDLSELSDNIPSYIYALLHVKEYRTRYLEFLQKDYPKIHFPTDKEAFTRLSEYGKELIAYHTIMHLALSDPDKWITQYPSAGTDTIAKGYPGYADGKVSINPNQYFAGVPEEVWSYTIGGYQPALKWLKDRVGRKLTLEEIQTYQQIILALVETIRIRKQLNEVWKENDRKTHA